MDAHPFYTIGHGTRPLAAFVDLLRSVEATLVADVRTLPRSRANPQYNCDSLLESLKHSGIGYRHIAALGGLRGRAHDVLPSVNAFWNNDSFHNYADYAMGQAFGDGFALLIEIGRQQRCAIMCAETLWWRCHRRIIADYLLAGGESVFHILGPGHVGPARMTEVARRNPSGSLVYPKPAEDLDS